MKKGIKIALKIITGIFIVLLLLYAWIQQIEAERMRAYVEELSEHTSITPKYYYNVISVSAGPHYYEIEYGPGYFYRLVTVSFEGYLTLVVEKISVDDEGIVEGLVNSFYLDNEELFGSLNIYDISVMKWIDYETVMIRESESIEYSLKLNEIGASIISKNTIEE